jgi:hypothetical protein
MKAEKHKAVKNSKNFFIAVLVFILKIKQRGTPLFAVKNFVANLIIF